MNPEYRNFADSFFSSEIWQNEGRIPLIIALVLLAAIFMGFMFGKSYKNEKLSMFSFYSLVCYGVGALLILMFQSFIVEGFNQDVANQNIAVKYDSGRLETIYHADNGKTVFAKFTDGAEQIDARVKFVFEKNGTEPFYIKSTESEENFNKIKASISKDQ